MKNPFKSTGFDTIVGKDTMLVGELCFSGSTVIDGTVSGTSIKQNAVDVKKSSLHVNGTVEVTDVIVINDLTVCGNVTASIVRVEGILAIKSGCRLKADTIYYRTLVAEPDAVIIGQLCHLDHSSDPQEV